MEPDTSQLHERLAELRHEREEIDRQLGLPESLSDHTKLASLSKQQSEISNMLVPLETYSQVVESIKEHEGLKTQENDAEMLSLLEEELVSLEKQKSSLEAKAQEILSPADPDDSHKAIVEIRAGTGGEEAAHFAADLYRMYSRYAERQGWPIEIISSSESESDGFKEVIFRLGASGTYGQLKYEAGVHRVQRVPQTEASGRIHTSTATVAVLPEALESELEVADSDLRIDVFRSGGHGGQSVNTTDSAVRITHIPTGVVVTCQDEKSQLKNKNKAMQVLRSRILAMQKQKLSEERGEARRSLIGSGERSEKVRTYNFPQDRLTDHRVGLTVHNLGKILDGDIGDIISTLHREALKAEASS
jgi:peptide chain release factor 1